MPLWFPASSRFFTRWRGLPSSQLLFPCAPPPFTPGSPVAASTRSFTTSAGFTRSDWLSASIGVTRPIRVHAFALRLARSAHRGFGVGVASPAARAPTCCTDPSQDHLLSVGAVFSYRRYAVYIRVSSVASFAQGIARHGSERSKMLRLRSACCTRRQRVMPPHEWERSECPTPITNNE